MQRVLYVAHPSMFRNRPILFLLGVAAIALYGLGLVFLLIWWFRTLAWIPTEEERPNENASALPENPGIFALSAPWSLCGSKSYRGVSHEVSRVIIIQHSLISCRFVQEKLGFGDHSVASVCLSASS